MRMQNDAGMDQKDEKDGDALNAAYHSDLNGSRQWDL
jgi:hypothetical protein